MIKCIQQKFKNSFLGMLVHGDTYCLLTSLLIMYGLTHFLFIITGGDPQLFHISAIASFLGSFSLWFGISIIISIFNEYYMRWFMGRIFGEDEDRIGESRIVARIKLFLTWCISYLLALII